MLRYIGFIRNGSPQKKKTIKSYNIREKRIVSNNWVIEKYENRKT